MSSFFFSISYVHYHKCTAFYPLSSKIYELCIKAAIYSLLVVIHSRYPQRRTMSSSESPNNTPGSRNGSMKSKSSHVPNTKTGNAQQSPSTIVQGTVNFSQSNKPARRGRQGPLTEEQRTEAAAVRKAGACRSCREKKIKASAVPMSVNV